MKNVCNNWFVYIVRTSDNTLYTGITTDLKRRIKEHSETKKGAKYLRGKAPLKLVYVSYESNRSEASKLECLIKKLHRKQKNLLIDSEENKVKSYNSLSF